MNFYDIVKDKIDIDKETGCWNWTKSTSQGYGQININKVKWNVHRLAYAMSKGEIPEDMLVRHKCNNRRCCNPDHVEKGTHLNNYYDSKDAHRDGSDKLRMTWTIDGWVYDSIRDASLFTGLPFATIVKYSVNGVFNLEEYRKGCQKGNIKPKL
ncbi:HNH endonuclease [Klebsiella phage vB_KpM_Centimanus]